MQIVELTESRTAEYTQFIQRDPQALFVYSDTWRRLLVDYLQHESRYLVALDQNDSICGALPTFLCRNDTFGNVLNSLPYFGSHGGVVEHDGNTDVRRALLQAFRELADAERCSTATLIASPHDTCAPLYEEAFPDALHDERIGQITALPDDASMASLFARFHYKTRNMIRKAEKQDVSVHVDNSPEALEFLVRVHHENMHAIGGTAKELRFFETIRSTCLPGGDYRIYVATHGGQRVAAVLLFYYQKTVEYFTPVVQAEFRSMQPLSLAIATAMHDAGQEGYRWWNWGGTWLSQEGVYRFKSRWGTSDFPYRYHTTVLNDDFVKLDRSELLAAYPGFYTFPFHAVPEAAHVAS